MSEKYSNRYRIASTRLQKWDYGSNGVYFVTICTDNRENYFGKTKHGLMVLNDIGKIAHQFWIEIPLHFPYVFLGDFMVMPNHVHGIIMINKSYKPIQILQGHSGDSIYDCFLDPTFVETPESGVSTTRPIVPPVTPPVAPPNTPPPPTYIFPQNDFPSKKQTSSDFVTIRGDDADRSVKRKQTAMASIRWKPATLGVIINQYKRICTLHARKMDPDFSWQSRYYDRLIRNEIIFRKVSRYIRLNPFHAKS